MVLTEDKPNCWEMKKLTIEHVDEDYPNMYVKTDLVEDFKTANPEFMEWLNYLPNKDWI